MNVIHAIQQNDEKAFALVYEQFHGAIYRFILFKTNCDFVAEEVTQLTFIKVWNNRHKLHADTAVNIQLFGIARQVMIDQLRKEATRFKHEGDSAETPLTDNLMGALESKDLIKIIEDDIANMPRVRRLVFELSRNKGMSHKEIAYMLDISTKTVEHHIGKALGQLKHYLYSIML